MTPANEALAFRIWAFCEPKGWDVSVKDIAEEIGVSWQRVNGIAGQKGWRHRLRKDSALYNLRATTQAGFVDSKLDYLNRWSA